MYRCKICDKKRKDNRTSSYRIENESKEQRIKRLERLSKYNKSEKGKSISLSYRYKSIDSEKGYDNDIDYNYLRNSRKLNCFYCGFKSTGLDRIDNKKGHTKENTVPCCKECNVARMDNFSHDEMIILGETIRNIKMKRIFKNKLL